MNNIHLKDLKNHIGYSFKNKQEFQSNQKQFVDTWRNRVFVMYIIGLIMLFMISKLEPRILVWFTISLISMVFITIMLSVFIKYTFVSYVFIIPLFDYAIASSVFEQSRQIFLLYLTLCFVSYIAFVIFLPINIFRKITPRLAFIPTIITIVTQIVLSYKDVIFSLMTNNVSDKVTHSLFDDTYLNVRNEKDFINMLYAVYNYIFVEKKYNEFYNLLSMLSIGITLTFLIGGILVTLRTYLLDSKAKKKWRSIIFSTEVSYKTLLECAYIGGTEYENLILSNSQYLNIIKENEENIGDEKDWKERFHEIKKNWKKMVSDYIDKFRKLGSK